MLVHGATVAHQAVRWSPVRRGRLTQGVIVIIGTIYIIATYCYTTRLGGVDRRRFLGDTGYAAVDSVAGDDGVGVGVGGGGTVVDAITGGGRGVGQFTRCQSGVAASLQQHCDDGGLVDGHTGVRPLVPEVHDLAPGVSLRVAQMDRRDGVLFLVFAVLQR